MSSANNPNAPPEINFHAVGLFNNGKIQKIKMSTSEKTEYYDTITDFTNTTTQKTADGYNIKAESNSTDNIEEVVKKELTSLNNQTQSNANNPGSNPNAAPDQSGPDPSSAAQTGTNQSSLGTTQSAPGSGGSRRRSSKRTQKRRQRKQRKSRKSV